MNAVAKVRTVNRFRFLSETKQRQTVEHYLTVYLSEDECEKWLAGVFVGLDLRQVLDNFAAGDDAANGVLLKKLLLGIGDSIVKDERYDL